MADLDDFNLQMMVFRQQMGEFRLKLARLEELTAPRPLAQRLVEWVVIGFSVALVAGGAATIAVGLVRLFVTVLS